MAESRKVVTIVFSDVTGSTALGEQLDPEAMRRIMERYFAEMREILERHGGTVEKFIGDAVMAVFGIPVVHEDDALRAVRAASEMRARLEALNEEFGERGAMIAVRTGVNTGEVVAGDPSDGQAFATGDAVNVAARLEQAAEPGEILLGPLTHELVRNAVRSEAVEALELKGKSEPVEAWRLQEVLPDVPAYTRRIDTPFVGRERELAALRSAFERARDSGSCELVTVTGAPGIGKSRLVHELVAAVGEDARVVVGRCLSYGEGITYWPLAEIVREVAGDDARGGLDQLLGTEADGKLATERLLGATGESDQPARTEEIFWATRVLLERLARDAPVVAVVDDVHWAEPTLLDLLEYLAGFVHGPVLVACTARPDLYEIRPEWTRVGSIELGALDDAQADRLIDALLRDSDLAGRAREEIRERAEGNPLFVEQMLALAAENGHGEPTVPPTIQSLLAARLDHLEGRDRAVLVRGAVEGRLFHRGAVSALLDDEARDGLPGRLLALARKSFVRPDESLFPGDDAFLFVHALVRDAAYDAAPKELRAELHERFAAWLEERAPEHDEIVGFHLEQSYRYRQSLGEPTADLARRAGERLAAAGERALARGDVAAAVKLLGRAVELFPPDETKALELAAPFSAALFEAGRPLEGAQVLAAAEARAREGGLERVETLLRLDRLGIEIAVDSRLDFDAVLREARGAIDRFPPDDDAVLCRAWERIEDVEWFRGRLDAARAAAEQAFFHAGRLGDIRRQAEAQAYIGASGYFGGEHIDRCVAQAEEALEWAREHGVLSHQAMATSALGMMAMERHRLDEGRELREHGWRILSDLGLRFMLAVHQAAIGGQLGLRALEPEAHLERLRSSFESLSEAGEKGALSTIAANLAFACYEADELDDAERYVRISEEAGSPDDVVTQVGWRAAKAMVIARRGDVTAGEALAREATELALASDYFESIAEAHLSLAETLRLRGRPKEAREALETALVVVERKGFELSADAIRARLAELESEIGSPSQ